jgi:hypothetical protein
MPGWYRFNTSLSPCWSLHRLTLIHRCHVKLSRHDGCELDLTLLQVSQMHTTFHPIKILQPLMLNIVVWSIVCIHTNICDVLSVHCFIYCVAPQLGVWTLHWKPKWRAYLTMTLNPLHTRIYKESKCVCTNDRLENDLM